MGAARAESRAARVLWGACAVVAAAALAAALAAAGWAIAQLVRSLAGGDTATAAKWGTMAFLAAAPFLVACAAWGLRNGVRRPSLRGVAGPALVVASAVAVQGLLARHSWFAGDDWLHIVIAHDAIAGPGLFGGGHGLNLGYLGREVFVHYAPGHRLGYWALAEVAPVSWSAALGSMLVLLAGSLTLFHLICVRLFGPRRSNLVLTLLFGTSIVLVPTFLWFADGLHKLPSTFLSLLAIYAWLRHRQEGSRLALAVSVAAFSLGLLFYIKVLFVPLYLVLIRVLFLEERPRRALRAVVGFERWRWLAFAPPVAIYTWNYLQNYAPDKTPRPSLDLLGTYLWTAWFKGVTPAFAGVEAGADARGLALTFAVAAQSLLVTVILVSLWRKRSAWRAWTFLGVVFVANATLVGLGRLGNYGLHKVASELRYDTEMAWLLPLGLGFAFHARDVVGARAAAPAAARRPWPWPLDIAPRRLMLGLGGAALCAYFAVAIATGAGISRDWRAKQSGPGKAYVERLRHDTAALARRGRAPVAIDDRLPEYIIAGSGRPWNRLERFVPAVVPGLHIAVAAADPLQVRDDGRLLPARLQPLSS
ncbi:MAG: hypothetical protein QOD53_498, partial [Thermoleophilaceae bacterium]|nr:hypothetical protein [Thermoleophilaceae bacterium]